MNSDTVVVHGTVTADGSLELDGKVPLPPGKVQVMIQAVVMEPAGHPFWHLLQNIWEERRKAGLQPRSAEEIEADRARFRDEWDERIREAGRLQEECRHLREEGGRSSREAS